MAGGDLAHNERLKLTATYVNGVAIALIAVGGFAPVVTVLVNQAAPSATVLLLAVICQGLSVVLHLIARRVLRELKDDGA